MEHLPDFSPETKNSTIYDFLEGEYKWIMEGLCNNTDFKIIIDPSVSTLATPVGKKEIYCNPDILKNRTPYQIICLFSHEIGHHDENVRKLGDHMQLVMDATSVPGLSFHTKRKLNEQMINIIEDIVLEANQAKPPYQYLQQYFTKNAVDIILPHQEIDYSENLFIEQFSLVLLLAGRGISIDQFKFHADFQEDLLMILRHIKRVTIPFSYVETWSQKFGVINAELLSLYYKYLKRDLKTLSGEEDWNMVIDLLKAVSEIYPEDHREVEVSGTSSEKEVDLPDMIEVQNIKEKITELLTTHAQTQDKISTKNIIDGLSKLYNIRPETAAYYLNVKSEYAAEIAKVKKCFFDLLIKDRILKVSSELPQGFTITPGLFTLGVSLAEQGVEQPPVFQNISEYPKPSTLHLHYLVDISGSMGSEDMDAAKTFYVIFNQAFLDLKEEYSYVFDQGGESSQDIYHMNLALFEDRVRHVLTSDGMDMQDLLTGLENITKEHQVTGRTSSSAMIKYLEDKSQAQSHTAETHIGLLFSDGGLYGFANSSLEEKLQESFGKRDDFYSLVIYSRDTALQPVTSKNIKIVAGNLSSRELLDRIIAQFQSSTEQIREDRGNGRKNLQWNL